MPLSPDIFDHYNFIDIFLKVIKNHGDKKKDGIRIRHNSYEYQFIFEWEKDICGIEVYRRLIPAS